MGSWVNLPLLGGGSIKVYETSRLYTEVYDYGALFNIDISDLKEFKIVKQSDADLMKTTINSFLAKLAPTSADRQLASLTLIGGDPNFHDSKGKLTIVDSVGRPTASVSYEMHQTKYVTAILEGTSIGKINWKVVEESYSGYSDYSKMLADNPNVTSYTAGIKFRMTTRGYEIDTHLNSIDDITMQLPGSNNRSLKFELKGMHGTIFDYVTPNVSKKRVNCNHGIFVVHNDEKYKEKYLLYCVGCYYDESGYTETPGIYAGGGFEPLTKDNIKPADRTEAEYMNELSNRFSPRYWSNSLGIYLISRREIRDVMTSIMETDVEDLLSQAFFGSDGKEYILGCRWYYGMQNVGYHSQAEYTMTSTRYQVRVGNTSLNNGTKKVFAHVATTEFATWTTSELNVPGHYGNYLDFMSTYQLFIPYYGFLDIAANDVVGGSIQLIYNINLISGVANIVVACKNSRTGNAKTKCYTVTARIGMDIPLGADMMKSLMANWTQTCGKAFMTGATLGTGMAMANAIENVSQANSALSNIDYNTAEGREAANNVTKYRDAAQASVNRSQFTKAVLNDINIKSVDTPHRSGGTNDEASSLDELHPYLLITRPVSVTPDEYEDYVGVPSAEVKTLSECSGFTQIAAVQPSAISKAPRYFNEIVSQLQAGVYL